MKLMYMSGTEAFCELIECQLSDAYLVVNDANEQCWTFSLNALHKHNMVKLVSSVSHYMTNSRRRLASHTNTTNKHAAREALFLSV